MLRALRISGHLYFLFFRYVLGPPLHPERMMFQDTFFFRHDDRICWLAKSVPFAFLLLVRLSSSFCWVQVYYSLTLGGMGSFYPALRRCITQPVLPDPMAF